MPDIYTKKEVYFDKDLYKWVLPNGVLANGRGVTRFLYPQNNNPPTDRMRLGSQFADQLENNLEACPKVHQFLRRKMPKVCKREALVYGDILGKDILGFIDILGSDTLIDVKLTQTPVDKIPGRNLKLEYCAQLGAYGNLYHQLTGEAIREYGLLWVNLVEDTLEVENIYYQLAKPVFIRNGFNYFVSQVRKSL